MEYNILSQKRITSDIGPLNGQAYRQVKLRNNNFAFPTGIMTAESEGGVAFGLRTEFGGQKRLQEFMLTRVIKVIGASQIVN